LRLSLSSRGPQLTHGAHALCLRCAGVRYFSRVTGRQMQKSFPQSVFPSRAFIHSYRHKWPFKKLFHTIHIATFVSTILSCSMNARECSGCARCVERLQSRIELVRCSKPFPGVHTSYYTRSIAALHEEAKLIASIDCQRAVTNARVYGEEQLAHWQSLFSIYRH